MSLSPEEISKEATSYVGGKLVDWGFDVFRKAIVERLSKRRAEEFFQAFAKATADPNARTEDFRNRLNAIMENERDSETLFEAYRAVCLSRSKILGPRCIALLTARIVSENRVATPKEEQWGQAYEMLSDVEIGETFRYFSEQFLIVRHPEKAHLLNDGLLTIIWYTDTVAQGNEIIQSPLMRIYAIRYINWFRCAHRYSGNSCQRVFGESLRLILLPVRQCGDCSSAITELHRSSADDDCTRHDP